MNRTLAAALFLLPVLSSIRAEGTASVFRNHTGPVLSIQATGNGEEFFTGGEDGFLTRHGGDGYGESWQVSDLPIRKIAIHPNGSVVALYETDNFSIHRISVWNWQDKKRLYAKRFRDSVLSLSWSARGSWLFIGNTSLEGLTVLEGMSGKPKALLQEAPGIVNLAATSSKETNVVTFGPSGRLTYVDASSGSLRASYDTLRDLANPILYGNNLKIIGIDGSSVVSIDATTGKPLSSWEGMSPILATNSAEALPLWIDGLPGGKWKIVEGEIHSEALPLPRKTEITCAAASSQSIFMGTSAGNIYIASRNIASNQSPEIREAMAEAHIPIEDIAESTDVVFLLSEGNVYAAHGLGEAPILIHSGAKGDRLAVSGERMIFWSSSAPGPVTSVRLDGSDAIKLFAASEGISSASLKGSSLSLTIGSSGVAVLDTDGKTPPFVYKGAGLQDSILLEEPYLAVTKSATLRSPHPLIVVNTKTGETVPLSLSGNLAYGFDHSGLEENSITGFIVSEDEGPITELITIRIQPNTPSASEVQIEAAYADEDLSACLVSTQEKIVTNLGKSSLTELSRTGSRQKQLDRGYALPKKILLVEDRILTLNSDGTLSWYASDRQADTVNQWITEGGDWIVR